MNKECNVPSPTSREHVTRQEKRLLHPEANATLSQLLKAGEFIETGIHTFRPQAHCYPTSQHPLHVYYLVQQ